ncbi:serine protease inhibitor A3K [Rattus rattus]|uniref:serine protease inhibitor A3K n=1 Tax=Rattus rattus TaxID=10117 RepID=UPI0013F2DB42|nr:serine protease inhibitor A3K [Rattus rattus]
MAFIAALGLLMAGICPAVLCDGTLGRVTLSHEDHGNGRQLNSLTLASSNTDFALSLYKKLALRNPDKNVVFSPLSISAALAIVSLGAKDSTMEEILEGPSSISELTEAEIHQGFGYLLQRLSQPEDQAEINTGSALFIDKQQPILSEFQEKTRALYQAEAFIADFKQCNEAKKFINDYVSNQTQGKIAELFSELDERTSMVLVNYLLFKGKWKVPFNPNDTTESEFYLDEKRSVKVPMMKIKDLTTPYIRDEELSCSVLELKYTGNASALFILPDQGKMQQVESSLQPETLKKWKDSLKPRIISELRMPKFSISTDYNLEEVLPELGIRKIFSQQADLSRITGTKNLHVSQVVHKAVLDVDETGTVGAAATAVTAALKRLPQTIPPLNFNRPFMLFFTDSNGQSVLFMGKVTNPM